MTAVTWLQNLLHGVDLTVVLIVLGYLICLFWIMSLMKARGMAERKAYFCNLRLRSELARQEAQANSTGPQVTAKTLVADVSPPVE